METKILLGEAKTLESVNTDNHINIELEEETNILSNNTIIDEIDEYKQYIKEKDTSNKYRLICTISPFCSNILFNTISEIVYKEGSQDCIFYGKDINNTIPFGSKLDEYCEWNTRYEWKDNKHNYGKYTTREWLIRDTGPSHPEIGLTYHCGADIFNNHIMRQKYPVSNGKVVERYRNIGSDLIVYFNTIADIKRTSGGAPVLEHRIKKNDENEIVFGDNQKYAIHTYNTDSLYSYLETIRKNLSEENGWIGFKNRGTVSSHNFVSNIYNMDLNVNKVLNNYNAGDFVDLYPDRTLFSFQPKYNEYRNRYEKNWDYCITYPYKNDYSNILVSITNYTGETINGIQCYTYAFDSYEKNESGETKTFLYEGGKITFGSITRHAFKPNSLLQLYILYQDGTYKKIPNLIKVENVGDANGDDVEHYFRVKSEYVAEYLWDYDKKEMKNVNQVRAVKVENGYECQYYFRKFRKLPNFKKSDVYSDGNITEEEIRNNNKNFDNNLNRVAFSKNIYGDDVSQIVFNDDIVTNGLKDNLGRPLSEFYLTIVKRNKGWKKWYGIDNNYKPEGTKTYGDEDIEFSHCFGKVTEGLDLTSLVYDYNIHELHNVIVSNLTNGEGEKYNPHNIIEGIKSLNDEGVSGDNNEFYGDMVEFSPSLVKETVLETVYHRFNTVQREVVDDEFRDFTYDEIFTDDDDIAAKAKGNFRSSFKTVQYNYSNNRPRGDLEFGETVEDSKYLKEKYNVNIYPEGYYYKPHYKIKLKEYSDTINEGFHTKVYFKIDGETKNGETVIITQKSPLEQSQEEDAGYYDLPTEKNYYFTRQEIVYIYDGNGNFFEGVVKKIENTSDKKDYAKITLILPSGLVFDEECTILKKNPIMPETAYDLHDITGKYVWRNFKSEEEIDSNSELYESTFTNGAHYRHLDINFYLRRQDPMGSYQPEKMNIYNISKLIVKGKEKDVDKVEYKEENNSRGC